MRKFSKLMFTLALFVMGTVGAKAANDKTYWTPSSAFGANWNAGTKTMSWTKNDNGWYILYTGFTPAVQNNSTEVNLLEKYTKMHINITSITGADNLELKIKSTGKNEKNITLGTGETDVVFADYSDVDFSKVLEITLWGTLSGENTAGSAVIDECYLLTNDRWEYQTQQQTVYVRALGEALDLSSVVTNNTLVSIASTDGGILFGAYDITDGTGNNIVYGTFDAAFAKIDAAEKGKATYRYKITEATATTDAGLVLPSGVDHVYCIQAFDGNGNLYRGPYWQDGYVDDLGWCTSVNKGDNGAAFFAFTPVANKTNTYKISSYKIDGTLQSANYQGKAEYILNVIGETPQTADVEVLVEVQGADTEDPGVPAVADGWISLITNGDLTGDDVTSFWVKDENGDAEAAIIDANGGRMNGRGIKVVSKENPANDWGTQFFIKSSTSLKEGQKVHIEFDYRADKAASAATQAHRNPGDYNCNINRVDFTVNWKHFSETYDVTADMCKYGDFLSFGLNLSEDRTSNNFYFDNLVMWTEDDPLKPLKIALQNAIELGNAQNAFAKTAASFEVLTQAISDGVAALADDDATEQSLTDATTAITNAINGLRLTGGYSILRTDMFHKWTSPDADATQTTDVVYPADELGKSIGQGTTVYGFASVHYLEYANLTGCNQLVILGTPGFQARLCLNRAVPVEGGDANGGAYVEIIETIGDDGTLIIDLKSHEKLQGATYYHLNSIKTPYNGKTGVISEILLQYDYSITGTLTGGWDVDADMTPTNTEGVYTLAVENFKANAQAYAYKLRGAHQWNFVYQLPGDGDATWNCEQAGTYNLTFTADVLNNTLNLEATKVINSMTIVGFTADTDDAEKWNPANGIAMTQSQENPAIWTAVVDKYIIRNENNKGLTYYYKAVANGSYGEFELPTSGNQNYGFNAEGMYKLTFTANTTANTVELAIEQLPTATIYFINTGDWSPENIKAYVWNESGNNGWPGEVMTATGEQIGEKDVYSWSSYALDLPTMIIISNNGSVGERTGDQPFVNGATYKADGSATVTKTITAAGYATYYCNKALDFTNSGLTAYIAKKDANNKVTFEAVTTVPANTGVLLKGTAGEYTIETVSGEVSAKESALMGVLTDTKVAAGIFVLMNGDKGVGFYRTTKEFTVGANTAYLPAIDGARSFIALDEATAIEGVAAEKAGNGEIYNLQGQRVVKAQKGLYIIDGKKVMVK